uniref:Sporulation-specific protein 15 n=1 Tax=Drosophila rhopaloa TaxID=1041015 RepID=A0A6P4EE56_DRORH
MMNEEAEESRTDTTSDPFEIKFPLPDHLDPSKCRDEFLSTIMEEHERRLSLQKLASTTRALTMIENLAETEDPGSEIEKGAEAMVVQQLARRRQKVVGNKTVEQFMESIRMRSVLLAELNIQIQKAAIEFLSVRLLKQLRLFSSPWPGEMDDVPYHLFSWSLDHFLTRLDSNQMYLDVINRERSTEDLDCLKFRTDLNEIEQIIYEIREDFKRDENLCQNSIQLIRDSKYNTDGAWVKGLRENLEIKENLKYDTLDDESSVFLLNNRKTLLLGRFEDLSATDPIELRYQINWVNSCMDQRLMLLNDREEMLKKELMDSEMKLRQDELVQHNSVLVYAWEVDKLRRNTREWQVKLDNDLENVEDMCTISKLALQKVKDDQKFYLEQEEIYRQRIAEVKELIAAEKKIRQRKQEKTVNDVEEAVKAIEAVYKPEEPKRKSAKF